MASYETLFPSSYLRAVDLGTHRVPVTISHVNEGEEVGRKRELLPVLYFKGKGKGLILNVTKCAAIAKISGTKDHEKWGGVKVVLYASTTTYGGESVPCILIDPPGMPKPEPEPEPEMEAPPEGDDRVPF